MINQEQEQAERMALLANKWKTGNITPDEKIEFEEWYNSHNNVIEITTDETREQFEQRVYTAIVTKINDNTLTKSKRLWFKIAAAASVLFFLVIGSYMIMLRKGQTTQQIAKTKSPIDIAPGHNQATLTLANGQKIILTQGLHGKLAQDGNASIQAGNGDAISYISTSTNKNMVSYNTMSTAKGESSPYPLILADGTKIWLNASSSITFPTAFIGKYREVKITGEVYFEVAHNKDNPFKVISNGQEIEVLGTHFNVNAYDDEEAIRTTLVEGSVRVSSSGKIKLLKPGEQSRINDGNIVVADVDVNDVVAWKNGYFDFNEENLESIMRKISRWYNVDVVFEDSSSKQLVFTAITSKYKTASEVMNKLALSNLVKFTIKGKQVIISKI